MVSCSLVPKSILLKVNTICDALLFRQLRIYVIEILSTIQQIILQVLGIDVLQLLFWLTILATVIVVYNFIKDVVLTYLCWFKCKDHSDCSDPCTDSCTDSCEKTCEKSCDKSCRKSCRKSCDSSSSSTCGC